MLPQHVLFTLVATVAAVPLNINLGAYSPALVVGDGEISLGSTESASELMATLASGAARNGNGEGQAQQGQQQEQQAEQPQGEGEQNQEQPAEGEAAKRAPNLRRTLDELLGRRAPAEPKMAAVEAAMEWIKRDLPGFEAALGYAREAMKDAPKIELGTENAGIGILVNPGVNVPQGSAAAGTEKAKRGEVVAEEDAPKMTLVAITEV
ncbi:Nn.00g003800.m01.CDS01 [Neocucurbitaria sp. VM-36]